MRGTGHAAPRGGCRSAIAIAIDPHLGVDESGGFEVKNSSRFLRDTFPEEETRLGEESSVRARRRQPKNGSSSF